MTSKLSILTIIPARGGSKGVPLKNLQEIAGQSLLGITIQAAQASRYDLEIVVSSDHPRILAEAKKYQAKTIKRPKDLATDTTSSEKVVVHVLSEMEADHNFDLILLLQPTSPFRTGHQIDQAIRMMNNNPQADSLVSVTFDHKTPYLIKSLKKNGYLTDFFPHKKPSYLRQERPETYTINGAIYLIRKEYFQKTHSFYSPKMLPLIMDQKSSLDIDEPIDLEIARFFAKK